MIGHFFHTSARVGRFTSYFVGLRNQRSFSNEPRIQQIALECIHGPCAKDTSCRAALEASIAQFFWCSAQRRLEHMANASRWQLESGVSLLPCEHANHVCDSG